MQDAIDMEPVKDKLRNLRLRNLRDQMPHADDMLCEFASMLADRLNPRLTPEGFFLTVQLLMYDLQTGFDGFTGQRIIGSLSGNPSVFYMVLKLYITLIAEATCPKDFAECVKNMQEELDRKLAKRQ